MEAEFCSLNREIHFIEVRYIKIWVNLPPPKQNYRILNKEGTFYNIKVCKLFVFLITPLFTSVRFSFGLKFFFLNQWNQTYSFNQIVLTILLVAVLYAIRIAHIYGLSNIHVIDTLFPYADDKFYVILWTFNWMKYHSGALLNERTLSIQQRKHTNLLGGNAPLFWANQI